MKTKQRFLFTLLMAIVMMAMWPMKMWADENPTLQLGKNVVTVYKWTVFNFTAGDAGTYRFYSEGNVDLNVSEFNGVGVYSSGAQGDNDVDGINFDWSIALEANSTNTIEIYDYAQTGNPTENCVVWVTYVGEGGGSGEESNYIKIELPIRLYDKDNNKLFNYIYNANTAYFNLGSEKKSAGYQLSSGEYTFTAEDKVYGFSFVGWYDDDDNLINTKKTFTQNVENNILYLPHYKANETTVIPDNRSFVSLVAIIEGEGEATFELEEYPGVSFVFVETGTTVKAVATTTSTTEFGDIYGNALNSKGEVVEYETEESSLEFQVVGNTDLRANFRTVEGGSGEGGETTNVLTVDENYVDIPANETAIFSFTPGTTGWYRFYSEGENDMELNNITLNGESVFSTAIGDNDYDSDYNFKQSIPLTAGSTYLLGISEYNGNAVENCKIVVSYVTPSVLNIDDNSVTIPAYEIATYTFTPTETGSYRFYTEGDNDMEIIDITLNGESVFSTAEGRNDIDDDDVNFDWSIQLTKGNTYLLAIKEYNVDAAVENCNLVVSYEGSGSGGETPTYPALTVNDNTAHIYAYDESNSSDSKYYFTFTPAEPGEYTFSFSNGGSSINVYAGFGDNANSMAANPVTTLTTPELTAQTTYNLYVDGNNVEYESATITITKVNGESGGETPTYQAVQEGLANVNEITIPAGDGYKLVQFTAPATFRFQFKTSASDYMVYLYSGVPGESGTTCLVSDLGECQWDCTGDQTYYIALQKCLPINQSLSEDEQIGLSILRAYQREMSYEWGTICLPFTIQYDPNNGNYKLYDLTGVTSSQLTFTEHSSGSVFGGRPLAVKAVGSKNAETGKYTINLVAKTKMFSDVTGGKYEVGDYTFKGTSVEMTNQTGIYFIAQNQFWWAEAAITVPAYRAYLEGPEPSSGAPLRIVTDDETEGIELIDSDNGPLDMVNGQCHDLMGRQIKEGLKGLQIRDGKVMFITIDN